VESVSKGITVNCLEFERRLDEGVPSRLPAAAIAHAGECARCARSLARARSLEHALEHHFAALGSGEHVPAGFADRVMARVERGEARGVRWLTLPDAMPWWVRVAAEPPVVLATGVAALLLWRGDVLLASGRAWWSGAAMVRQASEWARLARFDTWGEALGRAFVPAPDAHWSVVAAMAIAVSPVLALAGYALWRAGERLAGPAGIPNPR
jgi:hypothetical protein